MGTTILIIDDDPIFLEICQRRLASLGGYRCIVRSTPLMDAGEVADLAPNLILLDWFTGTATASSLPCIDLVTRLRQAPETAHIPIIICSAAGEELKAYSDVFIGQDLILMSKPLDFHRLVEQIATLVDRPPIVEPLAQP